MDEMLMVLEDHPTNAFGGMDLDYRRERLIVKWQGEVPEDVVARVGRLARADQHVEFVSHGGDGDLWRAAWELSWRFDRAGIEHDSFGPTGGRRTLLFTVLRQDADQYAIAQHLANDLEAAREITVRLAWRDQLPTPAVAPLLSAAG